MEEKQIFATFDYMVMLCNASCLGMCNVFWRCSIFCGSMFFEGHFDVFVGFFVASDKARGMYVSDHC